ncbi:MAG: hypothetical protein JWN78_1200 [Bacteroidota bacterium]|nr:hypothetical protein [Bacteroidota bacterium]
MEIKSKIPLSDDKQKLKIYKIQFKEDTTLKDDVDCIEIVGTPYLCGDVLIVENNVGDIRGIFSLKEFYSFNMNA